MQDTQGFKEKAMSPRYPRSPGSQNICIRILRKMAYTPVITWSPLVLSFVIAMWTPSNIFELLPFLKRYVEFVVFLVPSVQGKINHSLFPTNTALLLAYSWTLVLFYIPVFSMVAMNDIRKVGFLKYFLCFLFLMVLGLFAYFSEGAEEIMCFRACVNSRLFDQFVIYGASYPICVSATFVMFAGFVKKVFSSWFW
jgi:hypothetical protein